MLTVDEMRQDLGALTLPKNAGVPGGPSSIFGSVQSTRDGAYRRQLALDLRLGAPAVRGASPTPRRATTPEAAATAGETTTPEAATASPGTARRAHGGPGRV